MRACILTGGTLGDISRVSARIPRMDYVVCADEGLYYAEGLGLIPDRVVGDFDSVDPALLDQYRDKGIAIDEYPVHKDETDTQIAADSLLAMGASEIWLIAGAGTRLDHSYANLMLLFRMAEKGARARLINQYNLITPILDEHDIYGEEGQIVSFLPFGGEAVVDTATGLSYSLTGLRLPMTEPVGVSNVMTGEKAHVRLKKGRLLCMMSWDE